MDRVRPIRLLSALCTVALFSVCGCAQEDGDSDATGSPGGVIGAESDEFLEVAGKVAKDGGRPNGRKTKDAGVDSGGDVVTPDAGADAAVPGEDAAVPGEDAAVPGEDAAVPGEDAAVPGEDAAVPGEDAAVPGEDAAVPGEDAAVPGEDAAVPGEDAAVPEAGPIDGGSEPGSCDAGSAFTEERYPLGFGPDRLLTGDVNGDGRIDLVVANTESIGVLLGSSTGQFETGLTISIGLNGVGLADLDADGSAEIVISDGSAGWTELRHTGQIDLVRPEGFPNVSGVVTGDFTCDGHTDLVFMRTSRYLLVVPAGDPGTRYEWASPWFANSVIGAADYDGDGCTDLLLRVGNTYWPVFYFVPSPIQTDSTYRGVGVYPPTAVADLDSDGKPEVVGRITSTTFGVWSADTNTRYDLLAVDYYSSGLQLLQSVAAPPALVVVANTAALNIYQGDGAGGLVPGGPQVVHQLGAGLRLVKTTDLNGDGNDEIVAMETTPEPLLTVLRACR